MEPLYVVGGIILILVIALFLKNKKSDSSSAPSSPGDAPDGAIGGKTDNSAQVNEK